MKKQSWKEHRIFAGLSDSEFTLLSPYIEEKRFAPGEVLIRQGEEGKNFYIIREGEVKVTRKEKGKHFELATRGVQQLVGEMSLIDEKARAAEVQAIGTVKVFVIPDLRGLPISDKEAKQSILLKIMANMVGLLNTKLRDSDSNTVQALQRELQRSHELVRLSLMLIAVIIGVWFYSAAIVKLSVFPHLRRYTSLAISLGAIGGAMYYIRTSPHPLTSYGLTLEKVWPATKFCVAWSFVFIVAVTLCKAAVVFFSPEMQGMPVFELRLLKSSNPLLMFSIFILVYLLVSLLQEFGARGFLQTSLSLLFSKKRGHFWSIVLSNALYSMFHMHYSVGVAVGSFILGIFLGLLWLRHQNLLALGVAHWLIGFWCIEILNLLPFLGMQLKGM